VSGPREQAPTVHTGSDDRIANMYALARAALELLEQNLRSCSLSP
jgi:hypothetical protein